MRARFPKFLLALLLPAAGFAATAPPETRVEITPTPAGADLVTFFRNNIPVVSLLRDTLDDPRTGAHQFRQVWAFSYVRPNLKQRAAASIPFFYHRAGKNGGSDGVPPPILDISQPAKGTVSRVGEAILQSDLIDGLGFAWRGPTRAYRGNTLDYRNMHLARALAIVEESATSSTLPESLADEDWDIVKGRLALGQHLLGGFVSEERVAAVAERYHTEAAKDRAANFDMLRQSAEKNGLYVEALPSPDGLPREAILWFSPDAIPQAQQPHFNPGMLGISDPWTDVRLQNWDGYTQTWMLDGDGSNVGFDAGADDPGLHAAKMVPLALYALDYPRVPLLLIDFRSDRARLRELVRRTAGDVATSVFDLTPYSSISWFAARTTYLWVEDHRGGALNRTMREAAYARLREQLLETRDQEDPAFHELIEKKLDAIALNPFEQGSANEAALAQKQYQALTRWAADPNGLAKDLQRARAREQYENTHGAAHRVWDRSLQVASFGTWRPYKVETGEAAMQETVADLDRRRRFDYAVRTLRNAEPLPPLEFASGRDQIRSAAQVTLDLSSTLPGDNTEAAALAVRMQARVKIAEAAAPPVPGNAVAATVDSGGGQ